MTTHTYIFHVLGSQATSQGRDDPNFAKLVEVNQSVLPGPTVALLGSGPGGYAPRIPMSASFGANPCVQFYGKGIAADASEHIIGYGSGGITTWNIGAAVLTNNGAIPIRPATAVSAGRATVEYEITFDGNSDTWGASTKSLLRGMLTLAYPVGLNYQGLMHFAEFGEEPPDSNTQASQAVTRLLDALERGPATVSVGTQSNGVDREAIDCCFAALDPGGRIYIRPGDLGNQIEQIPVSVADNTAQHFRFFPSVFFRRGTYGRYLERVTRDTTEIAATQQDSQPFQIRQVDFTPTASDWLCIVDGAAIVLRIAHPAGSDFRRALECWNGAMVPLLQTAGGNATAAEVITSFDDTATRGLMDRLRYLQYARFIAPVASSETFNDQTQQDTININ